MRRATRVSGDGQRIWNHEGQTSNARQTTGNARLGAAEAEIGERSSPTAERKKRCSKMLQTNKIGRNWRVGPQKRLPEAIWGPAKKSSKNMPWRRPFRPTQNFQFVVIFRRAKLPFPKLPFRGGQKITAEGSFEVRRTLSHVFFARNPNLRSKTVQTTNI